MHNRSWLVIALLGVVIQLTAAGCGGGGGGLSSLFGGGSGSSDALSFASSGSDVGGGGSTGSETTSITSVATVHNPEPASAALFGGGLVALACLRRRCGTRSSCTS